MPSPGSAPRSERIFGCWDLGAGRRLTASRRPLLMGIVNITPDSFYDRSRRPDPEAAAETALALFAAGADIVDLGAESTRPGSQPVSGTEEQQRLLPALQALRRQSDAPVSVDTRRSDTAQAALDAGADAINDVTAGTHDPRLLDVAARYGCGLVLMHMQGTPATMQRKPRYADVTAEVAAYLAERAAAAEAAGVAGPRIVVDPGIGFGKRLEHNLALLARLEQVACRRALLVGASRKSFLEHLTGAPVAERLPGSLAALVAAYRAGAVAVRVHDVAASHQFLETLAAIDAATPAGA